jgi:hypothetical protein
MCADPLSRIASTHIPSRISKRLRLGGLTPVILLNEWVSFRPDAGFFIA